MGKWEKAYREESETSHPLETKSNAEVNDEPSQEGVTFINE